MLSLRRRHLHPEHLQDRIRESLKRRRDERLTHLTPKPENLASLIFFVRGEKVLLDADLAALYGVEARALNQSVARNRGRFPADFMFQLKAEEYARVRSRFVTTPRGAGPDSSQSVTSSRKHRGRAYRPYAFTEQGVAMLSSVLRARRAPWR